MFRGATQLNELREPHALKSALSRMRQSAALLCHSFKIRSLIRIRGFPDILSL